MYSLIGSKNLRFLLLGVIFLLLIIIVIHGIGDVSFHGHESDWIATSSVFEAFLTGDFESPLWNESYWTLTQPPIPRYLIGFGRRLGGMGASELNKGWNWNYDYQTNLAEGNVPDNQLLWWSRFPMGILGSITIFIGFIIILKAAGMIQGLIFLLLATSSHYLISTLGRAMGDAPLMAGIASILWLSYKTLQLADDKNNNKLIPLYLCFSILGIIIGLTGASKMNGFSALVPAIILAIVTAIRINRKPIDNIKFALLANILLIFFTTITWISINPYLYNHPIDRTTKMFSNRLMEMELQSELFPEARIESGLPGFMLIIKRIFQNHASITHQGFFIINIISFLIGGLYLMGKSYNYLTHKNNNQAAIVMILVGLTALPAFLTPLDWSRYYLIPVYFSTAFIAIGMGCFLKFVWQFAPKKNRKN